MRYIITAISLLLSIQNTTAQGISAGLRSGIGIETDITKMKQEGIKQQYWQNQMFSRLETNKKLAFEMSVTYYTDKYSVEPMILFDQYQPSPYRRIITNVVDNNLQLGLSAQYDISCKYLKEHCPVFKNFKSFIGINALATYRNSKKTSYSEYEVDGTIVTDVYRNNIVSDIMFGLSHTTIYSFNKHLFLTTSATFMLDPWALSDPHFLGQNNNTNTNISLNAGIGYKF